MNFIGLMNLNPSTSPPKDCLPNQASELTSLLYSNTSLSLSKASIIASKKSSTVISSTWLSLDDPNPMPCKAARVAPPLSPVPPAMLGITLPRSILSPTGIPISCDSIPGSSPIPPAPPSPPSICCMYPLFPGAQFSITASGIRSLLSALQ